MINEVSKNTSYNYIQKENTEIHGGASLKVQRNQTYVRKWKCQDIWSDEEPSGFSYEKKCEGRCCFIRSENTFVCSSPVKVNNADGWFKKWDNALLNSQCKLKPDAKMVVFR